VRSLVALQLPFEELLARTNRMFYESIAPNQYATLLLGRAGREGGVTLANAGHCPPVVLAGGRAAVVPPTSVPIGMFADAPFPADRFTLAPGDTLIAYTDGVSEAVDPAGAEYGSERLILAAGRHADLAPSRLVDGCLADLERFRREAERPDDVTLFALRRAGAA
jgi:phosphoserine phosphatase RsbU/P